MKPEVCSQRLTASLVTSLRCTHGTTIPGLKTFKQKLWIAVDRVVFHRSTGFLLKTSTETNWHSETTPCQLTTMCGKKDNGDKMDRTSVAICLVCISPQPDSRKGFQTPLLGPIMRLGTYTHSAKAVQKKSW